MNNIAKYNFSTHSPKDKEFVRKFVKAQKSSIRYHEIKELYSTELNSSKNDEEKKLALSLLKNNLLKELGVDEVFLKKCNDENVKDIENRTAQNKPLLIIKISDVFASLSPLSCCRGN